MKNKALLNENNIVVNIAIFLDDSTIDGNWVEFNSGNPAFINGEYVDGFFYTEQPFKSWTKDGFGSWQAPKQRPENGLWIWNETTQEWNEN